MKTILQTGLIALSVGLGAQAVQAGESLVLYNWFEYMPQELLDKFTAETGIEVTVETYDSNEAMLASLKAGSVGTYDLAVPSDYMVKIMIGEGLVQEITGELSNLGNVPANWMDVAFDPGRHYSVPYQWGSTSFAVSRDVYQGDINTTDILFNPPAELAGKINMLDSQAEVLAYGALHLGIPQCSSDRAQLEALNDMLMAAKANWASFNSDTSKELLVSGDAAVSMIYNGWSAKAREEGANIEYAYPVQGFVVWADNVVLLKDAPNRANALKFMDFLLLPENIAQISNFARYMPSITGAEEYLDPELASQPENNPPEGAKAVFLEVCDEATQAVYDKIWTNVKK